MCTCLCSSPPSLLTLPPLAPHRPAPIVALCSSAFALCVPGSRGLVNPAFLFFLISYFFFLILFFSLRIFFFFFLICPRILSNLRAERSFFFSSNLPPLCVPPTLLASFPRLFSVSVTCLACCRLCLICLITSYLALPCRTTAASLYKLTNLALFTA